MPIDRIVWPHPHTTLQMNTPYVYPEGFLPQYPCQLYIRYVWPSNRTNRLKIEFSVQIGGPSVVLADVTGYEPFQATYSEWGYIDLPYSIPETFADYMSLVNQKSWVLNVCSYADSTLEEEIRLSGPAAGRYAEVGEITTSVTNQQYLMTSDTLTVTWTLDPQSPGMPLLASKSTTITHQSKQVPVATYRWVTAMVYKSSQTKQSARPLEEAYEDGWLSSQSQPSLIPYNPVYQWSTMQFQTAGQYRIYGIYARYATLEEMQQDSRLWFSLVVEECPEVEITIYAPFSSPALSIASVTPAEYQEGNSDPLSGLPPYTVTLRDTSARGEYTIPVQAVTIDWGDVDSGTQNVITLTDIGNNPFADQTHTYTGYGPYTIRVSWTDMRGNVVEATTYFEASPTPRLIKPPELEPLEGYQPLLVTGRAHVAGKPIPEVEWSYTLQDGDYTGSKTGEYIELSLLQAGTYDFRCTTRDNGLAINETAWEITVEPKPIYPDNPIAANDLDVWVFRDGTRVDYIQPTKIQFTSRHAHPSYCEFAVPAGYPHAEALLPGGEIAVGYLGRAVLCRVESYDEDDAGNITVTAVDAASIALQNRVATVATRSTIGNGYDCQQAPAESLMRYFAEANLGLTPAEASRAIPRMRVVEADSGRGGVYTYSARYEDVLSIVEDICTSSGLGWDTSLQDTESVVFSFRVVEGANRTIDSDNPIIFDGREHSAHTATVGAYSAYRKPNVAITAGAGDGDTRDYAEYGTTDATDLDRWEQFVDAGDAADIDEMRRMGELGLQRHEDSNIVVHPGDQYQLGKDYHVGDFVTVVTNSGILLRSMQVHQARLHRDDTGVHIELECGSDLRGYQRLLREQSLANTYARK